MHQNCLVKEGMQSMNLYQSISGDHITRDLQLETSPLFSRAIISREKFLTPMSALIFLGYFFLRVSIFYHFFSWLHEPVLQQFLGRTLAIWAITSCGPLLSKLCPRDEKPCNTRPMEEDDDGKSEFYSWFYVGLGIGFAVGFLGAIFFNRTCRHDAYFRFMHQLYDMVI